MKRQKEEAYKLVRIKPYNKAMNHLVRRYTTEGFVFREDAGWYAVPASVANRLANHLQNPNLPSGPKVFDIVNDREEAKALEKKIAEETKQVERGTVEEPIRVHMARPGRKSNKGKKGE